MGNSLVDWAFWKSMQHITLWEAVLLYFGINPEHYVEIDKNDEEFNDYSQLEGLIEERNDIYKLIKLVDNNLSDRKFFTPIAYSIDRRFHKVRLSEFATWTYENLDNKNMPKELVNLVNSHKAEKAPADEPQNISTVKTKQTQQKFIPKLQQQEERILKYLSENNYLPTSLPKRKHGISWIKKEVSIVMLQDTSLFRSRQVFDKAWQRLRDQKMIEEV